MERLRNFFGVFLGYAQHGVLSRVKVPNGGWRAPTVSQRKDVRREAESEGGRRQTLDTRYTNPI